MPGFVATPLSYVVIAVAVYVAFKAFMYAQEEITEIITISWPAIILMIAIAWWVLSFKSEDQAFSDYFTKELNDPLILKWQSAITSVLVFIGVIVGLIWNSRLAKYTKEAEREAQMESIKNQLIAALSDIDFGLKWGNGESLYIDTVWNDSVGKVGAIGIDEATAILRVYRLLLRLKDVSERWEPQPSTEKQAILAALQIEVRHARLALQDVSSFRRGQWLLWFKQLRTPPKRSLG